jgi:hypothetical protein
MTRAAARRLATSWKAWAGLLLIVALIVIEVSVRVGLLSEGWTGVIIAVTVAVLLYGNSKTLRAKLLSR